MEMVRVDSVSREGEEETQLLRQQRAGVRMRGGRRSAEA